jgi:hypothetical protein
LYEKVGIISILLRVAFQPFITSGACQEGSRNALTSAADSAKAQRFGQLLSMYAADNGGVLPGSVLGKYLTRFVVP